MDNKEDLLYKLIGKRLKEQRNRQNITQQDLAQRASLTRTSVTNIEQGIQRAPLHVLYELSHLLGFKSIFEQLPASLTELESEKVHGARSQFSDEILKRILSKQ